jgi:TonB-linked SusC/RagA family outer membrane protein
MFKKFFKFLLILVPLIVVLGALEVRAQAATVTGTVSDEKGETLPGATVMVKGTSSGTTTDADGNFRLSVPANAVLVVSFVGYNVREVPVGNQTNLAIALEEEQSTLEEVVVVGYGSQKKVNLTGAVDVVNAERLENRPIASTGEGLQGLVPNLNITVPSGDPTSAAQFNIRGFESINGGAPLILVDGVPMDLNLINPQDIKSISVLKDGAASAIYGARAAFGVVLVETKTGKQGINVQLSSQLTWNKPIFHVDPIENGYEYAIQRNRLYEREGNTLYYTPEYIERLKAYWEDPANNPSYAVVDGTFENYGYTNLANSLMDTYSPRQKYDLAISGASDKASFYSSFGFFDTDGYINHPGNDNFQRYNILLKADYKPKDWITIDQQITVNIAKSDKPSAADINTIIRNEPIRPHVVPLIEGYEQYEGMYWDHGLMILPQLDLGGRETFSNSDIWLKSGLSINPFKRLSLKGSFAYNIFNRDYQSVEPAYEVVAFNLDQDNPVNKQGRDQIEVARNFNQYYVFNTYAEYLVEDLDNHYIKGMVGFNQELGLYSRIGGESTTLISPLISDIGATSGIQQVSGGKSHMALRGAFYRVNYIYKDRYLFEANGRYDGTSRFPKKDRYGFFPSFSAGWRISEEPFMSATRTVIENLKVRASYGSLGNQVLEDANRNPIYYPYIPSMGSGFSNYVMGSGQTPYVQMPGLVSPALSWERVITKNIGLDIALLSGKFETSFDVYTRETLDMLMQKDYPDVLGTAAPRENAADLKTTGWELSVKWRDKAFKNVNYYVDLNLADWTSEITRYDNPTGALSEYYVGQQLGEIWGYQTVGIIQNEEQLANIPDQSRLGNDWRVGDLEFADLNGDGFVDNGENTLSNPGDRKIIGNTTPRYSYGINTGLDYKGISLNLFFQGIGQRDYVPSRSDWTWFYPWRSYNGDKSWAGNSWSPENPDAYFPEAQLGSKNFTPQTRYLQDASYIRLKNINLGYTLSSALVSKIGLNSIKVYVGGQNLWEFSKIRKPLDPEYVFDNSINYPLFRSYTVGAIINL